jgi:hypothetical protein
VGASRALLSIAGGTITGLAGRAKQIDRRSELGQIEAALAALGKRLEITVRDAA